MGLWRSPDRADCSPNRSSLHRPHNSTRQCQRHALFGHVVRLETQTDALTVVEFQKVGAAHVVAHVLLGADKWRLYTKLPISTAWRRVEDRLRWTLRLYWATGLRGPVCDWVDETKSIAHTCRSHIREVSCQHNCVFRCCCTDRLLWCITLRRQRKERVERTQNRAARIVCNVGREQSSSRDLQAELLWLPVRHRIELELATLATLATPCFKAYKLHQLSYPTTSVQQYQPRHHDILCARLLYRSILCSTTQDRFSVAAPTIYAFSISPQTVDCF